MGTTTDDEPTPPPPKTTRNVPTSSPEQVNNNALIIQQQQQVHDDDDDDDLLAAKMKLRRPDAGNDDDQLVAPKKREESGGGEENTPSAELQHADDIIHQKEEVRNSDAAGIVGAIPVSGATSGRRISFLQQEKNVKDSNNNNNTQEDEQQQQQQQDDEDLLVGLKKGIDGLLSAPTPSNMQGEENNNNNQSSSPPATGGIGGSRPPPRQRQQQQQPTSAAIPGAIPVAGIDGGGGTTDSFLFDSLMFGDDDPQQGEQHQQDLEASPEGEDQLSPPTMVPTASGAGSEVVAEAITRDDLEEEIERRIIAEATIGEVVHPEDDNKSQKSPQQIRKERWIIGLIVLVATACLVAFLTVFLGMAKNKQQEEEEEVASPVNQQELQSFLVTASLQAFDTVDDQSRLQLISNPKSPQAQAMDWLVHNLEAFPLNNATTEQQILETYGLATLYYSTGGNKTWDNMNNRDLGLTSWMIGGTATDACKWLANPVTDCSSDNLVKRLILSQVNMTNTLPEELVFLTELEELDLSHNNLMGSLPRHLPSSLQTIKLDDNQFEGEFPTKMWSSQQQLTHLKHLSLSQNEQLRASLPADMMTGWGKNLEILRLDETPIYGSLPTTIGLMSNLQEFSAAQVRLSGEIPTQIGLCQSLQTFHIPQYNDLSSNITGKLPEELWSIPTLESIDISYVGLSFTIPAEAEYLAPLGSSLRSLKFGTTRIQGNLPTTIGLLSSLEVLEMDNSAMLGGAIPSQVGMMKSLKIIDLSRNPVMVGGVPTQIGNLANLEKLWLFSSSSFNESLLPTEIGLCTNLQSLNMKGAAKSSGSIPTQVGMLSDLVDLELLRTNMTGSIPSQLGLLQKFEVLTIGGVGITGTLPTQLAQAQSMTKILVAGTNVGGTIPKQYGNLRDMDKLALSHNKLTGTLPVTLAAWNKLDSFSIFGNEITGTFPREYQGWVKVSRVSVYDTNLTGEIGSWTCNGWGEEHELPADCGEVECDRCCTHCCDDNGCRRVDGVEEDKKGKGNKTPNFFPPIRHRNRIRGRARG